MCSYKISAWSHLAVVLRSTNLEIHYSKSVWNFWRSHYPLNRTKSRLCLVLASHQTGSYTLIPASKSHTFSMQLMWVYEWWPLIVSWSCTKWKPTSPVQSEYKDQAIWQAICIKIRRHLSFYVDVWTFMSTSEPMLLSELHVDVWAFMLMSEPYVVVWVLCWCGTCGFSRRRVDFHVDIWTSNFDTNRLP